VKILLAFSLLGVSLNSFAQAGGAAAQPGLGSMFLPLILTFGIMYFLMIRPQQKKAKEKEKTLDLLKPGERVLTSSGIFGKIHRLDDKIVTLEIANNVRIQILKSQLAGKAESTESNQNA
jgi:preprotein translocase subunit YajC